VAPLSPFLDPARCPDLYRESERLGRRTGALHRAKSAGPLVAGAASCTGTLPELLPKSVPELLPSPIFCECAGPRTRLTSERQFGRVFSSAPQEADLDGLAERPSQGWGMSGQIMDPNYAASAFYDHLVGLSGWQTMAVTDGPSLSSTAPPPTPTPPGKRRRARWPGR
jgi:hypothetical protein